MKTGNGKATRGRLKRNGAPRSPKLTSLSSCAGCAAKLGQEALAQVLSQLPPARRDPHLLVGSATADDAAVYRLDSRWALVQTVDFFTPIVDDPFAYGQIAAANALSDVYAMGGRPVTALNLVGMPTDLVPPKIMGAILSGGLSKAAEAGCAVVGGHTIRLPEPVYGMAVTGVVSPRKVLANSAARPGDWLVLTKPLGTGIVTTGIKRNLASTRLARKAIRSMTTLNRIGQKLAEESLVRAATDVTGFGLLGHLANICRGSGVGAAIEADRVPALDPEVFELIERGCIPGGSGQNLRTADKHTDWGQATESQKTLLTDAQTSGGLLLCVSPRHLRQVVDLLHSAGTLCQSVVGQIVGSAKPRIWVVTRSASRNGKGTRERFSPVRQASARWSEPVALAGRNG